MRVLVVEDERALADAVARGLSKEGFAVDLAFDGDEAIEKVSVNGYDVVVLDRDLPRLHGDDVCRHIVQNGSGPRVLMLTASGEVEDRVEGLTIGADDYLPKPFAFEELIARIRTLGRRPEAALPPVLKVADLELDPAARKVKRGGRALRLSNKEFGVLEVLMRNAGAVVSSEELLEKVWDEHADPFTNTVRVTVMNLRKKLGTPPVIETLVRNGYRIER